MTYEVNGMAYPVIGTAKMKNGQEVPLVDIPMMSDETWNHLARRQAVKHFIRVNGKAPENAAQALQWQREYLQL